MISNEDIFRQFGIAVAMFVQKSDLTDQEALKVKGLQRTWKIGEEVIEGVRRLYQDKLYKCRQAHITQADWTPDIYSAGWEIIDEIHEGTQEDPIPYSAGMQLYNGKYYTEENVMYLCNRDSEQALYQKLSELLGTYVDVVENR